MTTIQAIETHYAGCRFRSRTEARWAVFFDSLGVAWEYEPQGYELPSGPYLPDFWLPTVEAEKAAGGTYFEVKAPDAADDPRWEELAAATMRPLIVAFGLQWTDQGMSWASRPGDRGGEMEIYFAGGGWDNGRFFISCPTCRRVGITFSGWLDRLSGHEQAGRGSGTDDPRIIAAEEAARSARFEHGERG